MPFQQVSGHAVRMYGDGVLFQWPAHFQNRYMSDTMEPARVKQGHAGKQRTNNWKKSKKGIKRPGRPKLHPPVFDSAEDGTPAGNRAFVLCGETFVSRSLMTLTSTCVI